jgi:FKBP-type peptidyl-prolyl cis-trans isomerase
MNKVAFLCVLIFKQNIFLMKKVFFSTVVLMAALSVSAQKKPAAKPIAKKVAVPAKPLMKNLTDSFSYAAGLNIAQTMKAQGITKLNTGLMQKALNDAFKNKPLLLTDEQANKCLQDNMQMVMKQKGEAERAKGNAFLAANKSRKGVITLPNGLQYEVLEPGEANGIKPTAEDTVVVDYVGTLIDGKEFDNSIKRGEPATFPLNRVIKGWTEILQLMTKGAHWKVVIPSELGYGERGAGSGIPPNAVLVFEITLKDIKQAVKK